MLVSVVRDSFTFHVEFTTNAREFLCVLKVSTGYAFGVGLGGLGEEIVPVRDLLGVCEFIRRVSQNISGRVCSEWSPGLVSFLLRVTRGRRFFSLAAAAECYGNGYVGSST